MGSPLPIGMPLYDNYGCHQPPLTTILVHSLAEKVARLLKPESAKMPAPVIQSALLDVKQAAVYLGGYQWAHAGEDGQLRNHIPTR